MNKKILIVGMGFLGNYVLREFKNKGFNVIGTRLSINDNVMKLDITDVPISSTVSLGTLATIGDIGYHYQAYDNIYEFFTIISNINNCCNIMLWFL